MAENQLINELLCFLVNKLECMPADLLVKLICDFYDDKEIDAARECLFSLLPVSASAQRKVRRKGANKKSMTVQDMLHILLNTEVVDIPCFVARGLARLPPLTQDHFDLATVMRDVVNMRNDVASLLTLKDDVKTLSSQVFDIVALGKTTTKRPSSEAESPADTCPDLPLTSESTADIMSAPVVEATASDARTSDTQIADQSCSLLPCLALETQSPARELLPAAQRRSVARRSRNASPTHEASQAGSNYANAARRGHQDRRRDVRRSNAQSNPVIGSLKTNAHSLRTSDKARSISQPRAGKRSGLFITRLHPDTSERELDAYIQKATNLRVRSVKLNAKFKSYASFHVPLARGSWDYLLDAAVWPQGVLIKEFK